MPIEPNPYDRPDLLDLRKEQEDPIFLYIVIRESLNMSPGKIASQVAHGMGMFDGRVAQLDPKSSNEKDLQKLGVTQEWLSTSYRKGVLRADDKEWGKLKEELDVFLVKDAGLTEVDPGSETVILLWPMRKSARPKLVKRLRLL